MFKEKKKVFDTNNTFYKLLKFLSETKTKEYKICNAVTDYYILIQKGVVSVGESYEASSQQVPTTTQIP